MAHQVFISYSHKDKAVADTLCAALENAGVRCWIAPRDIAPGLDWPAAISNAIALSRIFLLVFSADSNASRDVGNELLLASNSQLVILPFKIEDVLPEPGKQYTLARTHWFEAANPPTWEQVDNLVSLVKSFLTDQASPEKVKSGAPVKAYRHNLPAQLTSFIGRTREISGIKQEIAGHRLVTLIGPGGTGKTRLALQVAADLLEAFPDGVWFIEFAPLADPALVTKTVATTLGLREETGRSLPDILVDYLRAKQVLLVLDNCEHLVEATARLSASLLSACPKLQVLASSREALGVPGEMPLRVPPLSFPDGRALPALETLAGYEAIQLFIERARTVSPAFNLTDENALAVVQVCQRLDGIPLAIELAAARTGLLKVEQISARLEDVFRLLTGSSRTALPRQQTLRATIDWSYSLLSGPERILLRRLAAFVGGWRLEAAEAVCASARVDTQISPAEILDLLAALVNKSLVGVEREPGQEARYRLLETVRQYALEKLSESGEAGAIRDQHLACFLALAEEAEALLKGPDQKTWFDRLELEHDNLRAALAWSLEGAAGRGAAGLQLASSLWWFWFMRGYSNEGAEWLEKSLSTSQAASDPVIRAKALSRLAWLEFDKEHIKESLAFSRSLGPAGRESLAITFWTLGAAAWYLADYARAVSFEEQALSLFRELGDRWGICETLTWLGMALVRQGKTRQALIGLQESLALAQQTQDTNGIAFSFWQLGNAFIAQGEHEQATRVLEQSLVLYKEIKQVQGVIWTLSALGDTALLKGDHQQAIARYKEVLTMYWEKGHERRIAEGLEQLARATVAHKQPEQTARLLGAAEALRQSSQSPQYPHEQAGYQSCLELLHSQLDQATYAACWAEGRAMPARQAVAYALEQSLP